MQTALFVCRLTRSLPSTKGKAEVAQYQVVHQQVTVLLDGGATPQVFRVAAPAGKDPFSGGWKSPVFGRLTDSYPDGAEWVFSFRGISEQDFTVDLYVTCL